MFEPSVSKCIRESTWIKTRSKIFSPEELDKINAAETLRSQNAKRELITYLSLMLVKQTPGMTISVEQHLKLRDLMMGNCAVNGRLNRNSIAMDMFRIEDEKFQEIFDDQQWAQFETLIGQGRASMERMKARSGEADETNDDDEQ